jgi:dTDP-4-amino-4,6-dideoxygalactose transaminase
LDKKNIYVTQPALPDLESFIPYLEKIWNSKQLTNNGPFHKQFEEELASFLGVKYVSLFANGTLALLTALQTLKISGEVITTPYSFVATTNALWWNNIKPVFVDVDPHYGNLDPNKIEAAITPKTTAILPVHVYGNPCKVDKIQEIADIYGLKVIYDAAHVFKNKHNGVSLLNYGDLSTLSFHATKPFNTMEGGAIICHDAKTKQRIEYLKNFGFADETTVMAPGINSKMNEMQAALGLLQIQSYDSNIAKRKEIALYYSKNLSNIGGLRILKTPDNVEDHNYPYYPVFIESDKFGMTRDDLYSSLKSDGIYGRRYFYPLISNFPTYKGLDSAKKSNLMVAHTLAEKVICLPIYPDLELNVVEKIVNLIKKYSNS